MHCILECSHNLLEAFFHSVKKLHKVSALLSLNLPARVVFIEQTADILLVLIALVKIVWVCCFYEDIQLELIEEPQTQPNTNCTTLEMV